MVAEPHAVYDLLKELYLIVDDGDRRLLGGFDLTIPRYYALVHLGESPGMSPSELSTLMLCDKSNITRIVKGLEREGLVIRRPHETDGRSRRLFLTETGKRLRREAMAAHRRYNKNRFGKPLASGQDGLLDKLLRLKQGLRRQIEAENAQ